MSEKSPSKILKDCCSKMFFDTRNQTLDDVLKIIDERFVRIEEDVTEYSSWDIGYNRALWELEEKIKNLKEAGK